MFIICIANHGVLEELMQKTCLLETIDFSMTFVRFCQYISDQFYIFAEALVVAMTTN